MPPEEKRVPETITVDDLWRVYIRAQDEEGRWKSVSIEEATDAQFHAWARTRAVLQGIASDEPWSPEERADFCDFLYQHEALTVLKGERSDYEEHDHA